MGDGRGMLADITAEVALTRYHTGRAILDPRVMQAMEQVPREEFVPAAMRRLAFADGPLPIGHGQTISQPFIVALMSDLLEPRPEHVVLEVGTGSGYQAAVLALLVRQVYSVEILRPLAETAAVRLRRLGYANVEVRAADAYSGWVEHAPFDGIIVTAAAPAIPPPLVEQLKPGGRLIIPVGPAYGHQVLRLLRKDLAGGVKEREILGVAFVPLTRDSQEV
jgi:protein-L-isoaspartate(D-aspartate) O-methyltransferase